MLKSRGESLGYDSNFLKRCSLKLATGIQDDTKRNSVKNLFAAFCGSGCPLRIANDEYILEKGDTVGLFTEVKFIEYTDFWTSSKTRGSDFVAVRPFL